ncbi:MAG: hypothetical protein N2557_07875 [Hydrogenophilus sp.]|nr:hypothetical protein [Hydrogenophilus sp.]
MKRIDYGDELDKAGRMVAYMGRHLARMGVPDEELKRIWHMMSEVVAEMFRLEAKYDTRPVDAETLRREYL